MSSPVVLLLLSAAGLCAQQLSDLSGVILDPSGLGVSDASITVVQEDTGFRRATTSRADGGYLIASLHPGLYKITVRKDGFRTSIRFGVKLDVSAPTRVDFLLVIGSVSESITVEGSGSQVNTEDASVGTVVGRGPIERLPLNGRGLTSLLELAPGTVITPATRGEAGQFSTAGQRPNMNYFSVDGVSANNGVSGGGLPMQSTGGSLPGMTAFGTLHSMATIEAVDEFRVQTSTAMTQFGRLPGAQISISSRSGTNELHGSLFGFMRHENLAANDWFANRYGLRRSPLRVGDFGGGIGGPLKRDRTFFFASYEGMRLRQPFAWRSVVPSMEVREASPDWVATLVDFFPAPNGAALSPSIGEWIATGSRPSSLNAGNIRLDHALTSAVSLFARFSEAPSVSRFGSTPVSELRVGSRGVTLGANIRLPLSMVLDLRGNASLATGESTWSQPGAPARPGCDISKLTASERRDPTTCNHLIRVTIAGVGQASSGREGYWEQSQRNASGVLNVNLPSHHLRFGYDYLRLLPRFVDSTGGYFLMAESVDHLVASQNLWTGFSTPREGRTHFRSYAAFVQDTWRVHPRFTASYGLRWEFGPAATGSQPAYYVDPVTGAFQTVDRPTWPPEHFNWAPRVGLAWQVRKNGGTVIRAGGGAFYDSNVAVAADLVNSGPFNVQTFGSGRFAPFQGLLSYGFLPSFRVPEVRQWNVAVEHAFTGQIAATLGYVGSEGRDLVRREMGGPGTTDTVRLALATNNGLSKYHGLQVQTRIRPRRGWQGLIGYSWAHSIDNSSTDSLLHWAGRGFSAAADRGSSDFDARHSGTAALTYESQRKERWLRNWALDGIFRARSGFPIDVLDAEQAMGLNFVNIFRLDALPGVPVWLNDANAPGGRRLNAAAFRRAANGTQGWLGRNSIRGFGMNQTDLSLRRDFRFNEHRSVQLRIEAFNLLNQANFSDPMRFLASPLFGTSQSMLNLMLGTGSPGSGMAPVFQTGGPRSVQVSLRLKF